MGYADRRWHNQASLNYLAPLLETAPVELNNNVWGNISGFKATNGRGII